MSPSVALWLSFFLLLGNAFFVGAEFAVMAARRSQLEPMAEAGSRRAQVSLEALEQIASLLTAAQLGITLCSVGLGAVAESALHELILPVLQLVHLPGSAADPIALVLALLLVAYLHVVVGEMVPKNLAIAGPDKAALALAPPLLYIARGLRPVIRLMEGVAKTFVRLVGVEPKDEIASAFTAEEVQHIVAESHREGLIEGERHGMVRGAIEFSDRVAGEVAVPLDQLVTLPIGATPDDVERLVARHGFSRYPFTDASGDLAGYLHLKDVLYADEAEHTQPVPLKRVRRLATVAPGDEVEDVLATMQRTGAHLARVVDTDGTNQGVVFLEDVLEELVGEVSDASQR
ncbi:hemolysin family protein [Oryzihumus sp.]|uniref:hemolysin family protein n=1 Tax=Oryzihumus sp. TaxID=1968903 RepID=UPI002ED97224